MARNFRNF
jgi:hypothetical protein